MTQRAVTLASGPRTTLQIRCDHRWPDTTIVTHTTNGSRHRAATVLVGAVPEIARRHEEADGWVGVGGEDESALVTTS